MCICPLGRSNVGSRVGSEVFTVRLEHKHTTEAELDCRTGRVFAAPSRLWTQSSSVHLAQIPGWLSLTPVWLIGLIPAQCLAKSPTACLNAPRRRTRGQETQYFQSSCTIARWLQRDSLGLCASVASVPRRSRGYACHGDRAVVFVRAVFLFIYLFFFKAVWCLVVQPLTSPPQAHKTDIPAYRLVCVCTFKKNEYINKRSIIMYTLWHLPHVLHSVI